jgi:hypothetical protein
VGGVDLLTLKKAKQQAAVEQAELQGDPLVYLPLRGDLRDRVTGQTAAYSGGAKTHPVFGTSVSADEPAYTGTVPGTHPIIGRVLDDHDTRWFPLFELTDGSWVGVDAPSIVHSTDKGANFTTLHTFAKPNVSLFKTAQGGYIAIVSDSASEEDATQANGQIWRSTDECETWEQVGTIVAGDTYVTGFDSLGDVCYLTEYGGRTYPNNARRLYRSVNDGETWTMIKDFDDFTPESNLHTHFVRIDPYTAQDPIVYSDLTIYVGTGDGDSVCGLHRSQDGGETWETIGSGSQAWRITEARFDAENAYFGGDGYVGNGERYGLYRLRKSDDNWAKEADVQGPVYSMVWDKLGNLWASVQQSPLTPPVQDIGGADWSSLLVRHAGHWVNVYNSEGHIDMPAGLSTIRPWFGDGMVVQARQTGSVRVRGSLLIDPNSPYAGGVHIDGSDVITAQLPKELPTQFTVLMVVKLLTPIPGDSTIHHLWSCGGAASDMYRMYVSSAVAGKMRLVFARSLDGDNKAAIVVNGGPAVGVGECAVLVGRMDNGNLSALALNVNTRQTARGYTAAEGTLAGIRSIRLGQYVSAGYPWGNVLGEFRLFYRALSDCEMLEEAYRMANYAR